MSFDKEAQKWDQNTVRVKRAEIFAGEILNFISGRTMETALEFGSGTGLLSENLKDRFKSITLVDTSEGMIDVLKEKIRQKKLKNFHPIHLDMLKEDFSSGNFDMIYTLMTLHHILDLNKVFRIFHSKLKNNGLVCIADLEKEDGSFHGSGNFEGHYGFDRNKLSEVLKRNHFKEVYYAQPISIDRNIEGKVKEYPLFLMIAQKIN